MNSKEDFKDLFSATINKIVSANNQNVSELELRDSFTDFLDFQDASGLAKAINSFLMVVQSFDFNLRKEIHSLLETSDEFEILSNGDNFDLDMGSDAGDVIYYKLQEITNKIDVVMNQDVQSYKKASDFVIDVYSMYKLLYCKYDSLQINETDKLNEKIKIPFFDDNGDYTPKNSFSMAMVMLELPEFEIVKEHVLAYEAYGINQTDSIPSKLNHLEGIVDMEQMLKNFKKITRKYLTDLSDEEFYYVLGIKSLIG